MNNIINSTNNSHNQTEVRANALPELAKTSFPARTFLVPGMIVLGTTTVLYGTASIALKFANSLDPTPKMLFFARGGIKSITAQNEQCEDALYLSCVIAENEYFERSNIYTKPAILKYTSKGLTEIPLPSNFTPSKLAALFFAGKQTVIVTGVSTSNSVNTWQTYSVIDNAWQLIGTFDGAVLTKPVIYNDTLVVGGEFTQVNGKNISGLATWNGSDWQSLGVVQGKINSIATTDEALYVNRNYSNGGLLIGGKFTSVEGIPAHDVALFTANKWSDLGHELLQNVLNNGEVLEVYFNGHIPIIKVLGIALPGGAKPTEQYGEYIDGWRSLECPYTGRGKIVELIGDGHNLIASYSAISYGRPQHEELAIAEGVITMGSRWSEPQRWAYFPYSHKLIDATVSTISKDKCYILVASGSPQLYGNKHYPESEPCAVQCIEKP